MEVGTTIQSPGNVTLTARLDIDARAAMVVSQNGAIQARAGPDLNITSGETSQKARNRTERACPL